MEENSNNNQKKSNIENNKKGNSTTSILIVIIVILAIFIIAMGIKINNLNQNLNEKNEKIDTIEAKVEEFQKMPNSMQKNEIANNNVSSNSNSDNEISENTISTSAGNTINTVESATLKATENSNNIAQDSSKTYEIKDFKNVWDIYSDNDTEEEKAKKIANTVETAINEKDYYFLAKLIGASTDTIIKYGFTNFKVDINSIKKGNDYNGYYFNTTYDWDKTKIKNPSDESIGNVLVITFDNNSKNYINIEPFCTGGY